MRTKLPGVSLLAVAAAAVPAPAQTLDQLITNLRPLVLPSGWIDNHAPDGILHDHGTAIWEMPTDYPSGGSTLPVTGGGYMHELRRLKADPTFYHGLARPSTLQFLFTQAELDLMHSYVFEQVWSRLLLPDFATLYDKGSSIALQNLVFAPQKIGGAFGFWSYPEVDSVLAAASGQRLSAWGNIGFSNNALFFENDFEFAMRHGQQRKTTDPFVGFLFDPNVLAAQGIAPETYIHFNAVTTLLNPDKPWFQPVLDFIEPTVLNLGLASIGQVVQTYRGRMKYFVGGEYGTSYGANGTGPCEPPHTNYSPRSIASFQAYMQQLTGGSIAALNARWGSTFASYAQIQKQHVDCAFSAAAVADFHAFQSFLHQELLLLQYRTAKERMPEGVMGSWSFGPYGTERSWLESDLGATGDWYGSESGYFAPFGSVLGFVNSATRLSGRPTAFGITSPPTDAAMSQAGCATAPPPPPKAYAPRCISAEHFRLFLRDVMTAGIVNIGYVKAPGYGFFNSQTLPILHQFLQDLKAARPQKLRSMTPYQRVAVHLDEAQMRAFPSADTVGRWLVDNLEQQHVPHAIWSDLRVMERTFALRQMARSTVLSSFHRDLAKNGAALVQQYLALAGQPGSAPIVAALTDVATALQLLPFPPNALFLPLGGVLVVQWNPAIPFFLLVFPDDQVAANQATLALLLPVLWGVAPEPARPFSVSPATSTTELRSSHACDGLNFYLAVSNRSTTAAQASVSLAADPRLIGRFQGQVSGYTFENGASFPLSVKGSRFLLAKAIVPGLANVTPAQLQAKIASFEQSLLARQAAGFDASAGLRLCGYLRGMDAVAHPERVLAGLVRLANLVLLKATRAGAAVSVTAVRHDGTPVVGADVQALHLLDGHQHQDVGVTDASGQASFLVAPPQQVRWDFFTLQFGVPGNVFPATEPIEVHVHDRPYGSQSFLTL